MAIISRLTNNESGRRSFKLSLLEMLILGLILVVVFYLISLWITGAFEAPKQAAPAAAPAQLLDRALAATERAQARLLTIEKKLAALEDQLDKAGPSPKGKRVIVSPKLNSRLDALEKKVAALGKAPREAQPASKVDLTPLEARLIFLEKKLGEKPSDQSVDQRLDKLDQRLKQVAAPPAPSAASAEALEKLQERLGSLEERTKQIAKEQAKQVALPSDLNKLQQRLKQLEERSAQIAKQQDKAIASPGDVKKLDQRLAALEKKSASGSGVSKVSVPQDIEDRLRKLESTVKKVEPSEAHTSASLADLETRLQTLERSTPRAGAAAGVAAASLALMETRLHKIEATLNQTSESLRKVRAPVTDPELTNRLERLEKASGASQKSGDKAQAERARELEKRLTAVDKRLAELGKAQALTSRHLAQVMEDAKAAPAARPSPRIEKPEKKTEKHAEKPPPKTRMITHTVRRGQTLYGLARRYKVKVSDIRRWNPKLQNRKNLWINEDLIFYVTR